MTNDMGYWREHPAQYFSVVYIGGACLLAQLAERFGLDRFLRILERYAARHRYGIARTSDFVHAIDRAAARHLPGFDTDAFWAAWRVGP
jgi:aminopeptidase N